MPWSKCDCMCSLYSASAWYNSLVFSLSLCHCVRRNLLSPKRKFWYAMFALTPGTVLGLFLNSVKNDMERENDVLRLQHIQEELQIETEREQKDELLMSMIQELRSRLQSLELEVSEKNALLQQQQQVQDNKKNSANTSTTMSTAPSVETQAPAAITDWEKKKVAFLSSSAAVAAASATSGSEARSGINMRVKQRERDVLQKDVRAFKAAAATANDKPTNQ